MAKIVKIKARKMPTFKSPGNDDNKDWISAFILGKELIDLSGRRIRKVLSDFMLELVSMFGSQVITETVTTKISSQFQGSRM